MYSYIFRRIYQLIIVFFLFLITSYVLFDSIPGNAFQNLLLNPDLPPEAYEQVIKLYCLDKPLSESVILYIGNFFQVYFGYSYKHYPRTHIELIAERLPRTLMLFAMVNIVAFYTGFLIGKTCLEKRF